jgi:hypothetical protein
MLQHISPPEPSIAEGVEGLLQYAAAREETTVIFAEITQKADPARRSREHGRAQATYPPSLSATTPITSRLCVSGAAVWATAQSAFSIKGDGRLRYTQGH